MLPDEYLPGRAIIVGIVFPARAVNTQTQDGPARCFLPLLAIGRAGEADMLASMAL